MIMKQFLNFFRPYCLYFLRKYFYCFIRNISYLIMQKELYYNTNTVKRSKKIKIYKNFKETNELYINKSCDNFNKLKGKKRNKIKNLRYNNINDEVTNKNDLKYNNDNIINTPQKTYAFKNIFISLNSKKKKNHFTSINKFFIKRIKNIITKDKKLYITINYIFSYYPKKNNQILSTNISQINSSLKITQINSLEYFSTKNNEKLCSIKEEEKEKNPIINLINNIYNIFISKDEKNFLFKWLYL